ncbi:nucleoside monophosphate kinase [Candidatus Saccharibacteria bacterium]|nr:nucleoside monophosphate kinase [Candidatus Saccharibacteria bacterium]
MLIFFGPVGAGKSTQGQMLAERHGWLWLSTGQMFRDSNDPEVIATLDRGQLITDDVTNQVVAAKLVEVSHCGEKGGLILDGYPRNLMQAEFLVKHETERCGDNNINLAINIAVTKEETLKRLMLRARTDDTVEAIENRLEIYHSMTNPVLKYLADKGVTVVHIDGSGTVDEIHGRIEAALAAHGVV